MADIGHLEYIAFVAWGGEQLRWQSILTGTFTHFFSAQWTGENAAVISATAACVVSAYKDIVEHGKH